MQALLMLTGALLSPLAAFGLLLWLTHLEETLPQDVKRAQRQPAPAPILAIPVRQDLEQPVTQTVLVPEQRPDSQAFSRSARLSLGGSTKR